MDMFNSIACEIETISAMLDNINKECIVVWHQGPHSLSKAYHRAKSFYKIDNITIKAKINKQPNLLAKQATPGVFSGCGLWSTFLVSPTEELWVHTTSVFGGSVNSPGVFGERGFNTLIKK